MRDDLLGIDDPQQRDELWRNAFKRSRSIPRAIAVVLGAGMCTAALVVAIERVLTPSLPSYLVALPLGLIATWAPLRWRKRRARAALRAHLSATGRCPECGYLLARGAGDRPCPECGVYPAACEKRDIP